MRAKLFALFVGLLFAPNTFAPTAQAATLHVAAAANLQQILSQALVPAFQQQTGNTVTVTYGSTKLLATQLQNGSPTDVFLSADTVTPQQLAAQGLLVSSTVRVYAIGQLVMWTRQQAAHHPRHLQDLASPVYAKIAIASPAVAPYGQAAVQSFAKSGLTARIAPRLVTAENIGECLQYARSGNADVALTALSLVINDKMDPYVIVPEAFHAPIAQSLGLVKGAAQPALGQRFIAFLSTPAAAKIWHRYGYELPRK